MHAVECRAAGDRGLAFGNRTDPPRRAVAGRARCSGAAGPDPRQVATQVDALLAAEHYGSDDTSTQPAPLADDTTFLRRLSLDLVVRAGRHREHVIRFALDPSPDSRLAEVERLLADGRVTGTTGLAHPRDRCSTAARRSDSPAVPCADQLARPQRIQQIIFPIIDCR